MVWRMHQRCMSGNLTRRNRERVICFTPFFNDGDGDKALFGNCPEVGRVDNCTAWRPMSSVLATIPRIIHPEDVKTRVIHVAGRQLHFVCGVSGTEGGRDRNIPVCEDSTE